ncbi:MAG: WD40 repeat domain-containing protein, partial [Cyanobacteriota bacterium]
MASRVKADEKLASKSPALQRARLAGLSNLVRSKKPEHLEKYFKLLIDFEFLIQKIEHPEFGVQALIADYELIDTPEESHAENVKALKLIQGALELSAHILCKEKTQLAEQLWGRMQSFQVPSIQEMLSVAKQRKQTPWLRPLTASLTPPGGRLLRTLSGHSYGVTAVAISPDGTKVISGSSDKTLEVWHLDRGEELLTLEGHSYGVTAVAISPDGTKVISGSSDKTLKVWHLDRGEELLTLEGHSSFVNAVAISPDGTKVISASDDKTLKVWHLDTGEQLLTLEGHSSFVNAVTISPDGKKVISGSWDKTLKVWHLDTGEQLLTLEGHSSSVNAVAISPDGTKVIS